MASENSVVAVIRASRPSFRNDHDKVAFVIHASFLASGFSLIAVGRRALDDNIPIEGEEVGVEGWNELDDAYGFAYSCSDKGTKKAILVKCLPLEDYLMIDAVELKSKQKEPFHLQIHIKDYLADIEAKHTSYGDMYKNLHVLITSLNSSILEQASSKTRAPISANTSRSDRSACLPAAPYGGNELYPGLGAGFSPERVIYPSIAPNSGSDLYPGPGAGFYPERGTSMGGSMLVGPNDRLFFGSDGRPGNIGRIPGVPPNARFDPYGPPDVPGFEPARFVRQPRQPGGGTHPDLEHFHGSDFI